MALQVNGTNVTGVQLNGATVSEVRLNGVSVWTSGPPVAFSPSSIVLWDSSYDPACGIRLYKSGSYTFEADYDDDIQSQVGTFASSTALAGAIQITLTNNNSAGRNLYVVSTGVNQTVTPGNSLTFTWNDGTTVWVTNSGFSVSGITWTMTFSVGGAPGSFTVLP